MYCIICETQTFVDEGNLMNNKEFFSDEILSENVNVLLIAIYSDDREQKQCDISLAELKQLAETSLGDIAENSKFYSVVQCRKAPEAATFIGKGKALEAADLCKNCDISLAIVDAEMSPSQIKNLEDILNSKFDDTSDRNVRVIDRTMLILHIFAKHAVTGEGKHQVEIAQLKYTVPRLTGKGTELSRQGGTSGSIGSRGPGETKLETDRRYIKQRIQALKNELSEMEKERSVKRSKRSKNGMPSIAIAGYTNAGKSTLLNYLTNAGILAENKLFATLDPTVRKLSLPSGREVLLSDTVGFINKLPHGLVEAFKSTLDEVRYADIILIVIDVSDNEAELKTKVTEEILNDLDAGCKPTIYVFNKSDMCETVPPKEILESKNAVSISAKSGAGIDDLLALIDKVLSEQKKQITFKFPFNMQSAVDYLYRNATVISTEYTENGTLIKAFVSDKEIGLYSKYILAKSEQIHLYN